MNPRLRRLGLDVLDLRMPEGGDATAPGTIGEYLADLLARLWRSGQPVLLPSWKTRLYDALAEAGYLEPEPGRAHIEQSDIGDWLIGQALRALGEAMPHMTMGGV